MYPTLIRRGLYFVAAVVAAGSVFTMPARGAIGRENFLSDSEQQFVNRAWGLNATQIALGKSVERQAANADVKAFGERTVAYHSDFNDELKGLARQYRGSVPERLDADDQALFDRVSGLSGPDFDREYMRAAIDTLRQTISLFERQSKDVGQTPTDKWAGSVLPKLQRQLQVAERIGRNVGVPDTSGDGAAVTAGHNVPANSGAR